MIPILSRLLVKRGLKDATELTDEERIDFDNWQKVLGKDEVEIKDILEFCEGAMGAIEVQFGDTEIPDGRMAKLTLQHSIYKKLRDVITTPKTERETLIAYLTNLLK